MAEQEDNNWFGSWLNAAKDKSSKVLEFVKKDLEEFGTAVKNEASNVVNSTGTAIEKTFNLDSPDSTASSMKRSFSSFLGQMNTVLNPSPDDSDTEAILIVEDSGTVTLTGMQKAIYELQKDDKTFTDDPDQDHMSKFECWLEIVDEHFSEERLRKHLDSSSVLRRQYEKMVPEIVPLGLFWKRYLFKKALLEDKIAHEEEIEKREQQQQKDKTIEKIEEVEETQEQNVRWEHEDLAPYIELSEEEQIKLLQDYENEIKNLKTCDIKTSPKSRKDDKTATPAKVKETDSAISLDTTSSSTSSNDGDWEKISDIEK